jgi:23S rRNA pseudouridine955/2504/2580 synthase
MSPALETFLTGVRSLFLCHAGLRAASSHGDVAYRGPGMLHHLLAGPSGSTATVITSAGSTPSTLNSDKSNTYDNNVVQRIIGAKAGRPASTAVRAPAEAAAPAVRQVEVDEGSEGQRLDNFLIKLLKGVPKTHVYRVIRSGEVRVNKGRAAADTRLAIGDLVRVPPVRMADPSAVPPAPAREFPVVFEDEHLMAVNKPAGVAVHGGSGVSSGVIEQLRQARPTARFLELVHRLDKETSGLLLIAKKRSALVALQEQFRSRETGKTYAALVVGAWPASRKVIDVALHKFLTGEGERRVRAVDALRQAQGDREPEGRRSITLVRIAQAYAGFTLLDVTIKTGRTHQIRVHLAHEGHPIAGDEKYGDFAVNKALARGEAVKGVRFERMFLHARRLRFEHPASGEAIELEAPLPAECSSFLQTLPS